MNEESIMTGVLKHQRDLMRENHRLRTALQNVLGVIEESVSQGFMECRGDEDCDHCLMVHEYIGKTLEPEKYAQASKD